METDTEDSMHEKFEHFEGFSYMGTEDLEAGSGSAEDEEALRSDGTAEANGEGGGEKKLKLPARKRRSEEEKLGDVFIEPRNGTVEDLGEEIRKL